ncbi:MAG: hypothetical protein K0U98_16035 [Deltaproteobacteria bacterium]|nr:hypothetical protein [Deltaproteobacteria bacterium]
MTTSPLDSPTDLPLASLHEELNASWMVHGGVRVPARYGSSSDREDQALNLGTGLIDLSFRDHLDLHGEDRLRFLNGQMTCDVKDLQPGQGVYGFFATAKGRIEADGIVFALEDRLRLELPPGTGALIRQRLEKYIIADRVEIHDGPKDAYLLLAGPGAQSCLTKASLQLPKDPWNHLEAELLGNSIRIVHQEGLGIQAFALWSSPSAAEAIVSHWIGEAEPSAPQPVGFEALNRVRIEAGIPWFGADFGPENLPQETGLDQAINFTKGCYLGQEIIARLHYRGQISRGLRRLKIEAEAPPAAGTELFLDGKKVGSVTSAASSSRQGGIVGLGIVQRKAFEGGTQLQVGSLGTAEILPPAASPPSNNPDVG